jgi:nitrile hydratase accessory protein
VTSEYSLDGAAAPPMQNGELVFEAPWQGRAFGIARGMAERGVYTWDDFRERLIAEIGTFDRGAARIARAGGVVPEFRYYDHFLRALETLLVERRIVVAGELRARVDAFEARPHGHDHGHADVHDRHHDHSRDHVHGHDVHDEHRPDHRHHDADHGRMSDRAVRITRIELEDLSAEETAGVLGRDVSACLAFVDADGYPRQVPCWFFWDGEAFYVTSLSDKFHVRRLRADPRASICVEIEERTEWGRRNRQVKGVGRVEIFSDAAGDWSRRIRTKYLGDIDIGSAVVASRVVLRLKPDKLAAHGGGVRIG